MTNLVAYFASAVTVVGLGVRGLLFSEAAHPPPLLALPAPGDGREADTQRRDQATDLEVLRALRALYLEEGAEAEKANAKMIEGLSSVIDALAAGPEQVEAPAAASAAPGSNGL